MSLLILFNRVSVGGTVSATLAAADAGDTVSSAGTITATTRTATLAVTEAAETGTGAASVSVRIAGNYGNNVANSTFNGAVNGSYPTGYSIADITGGTWVPTYGSLGDGTPYMDLTVTNSGAATNTFATLYLSDPAVPMVRKAAPSDWRGNVQIDVVSHSSGVTLEAAWLVAGSFSGGFTRTTTGLTSCSGNFFSVPGDRAIVPSLTIRAYSLPTSASVTYRIYKPYFYEGAFNSTYYPSYGGGSGIQEAGDTVASSGTVVTPPFNGTLNYTESPDTVATSCAVSLVSTLAATDSADTLGSQTGVTTSSTLAHTDSADTLASLVGVLAGATLAVGESSDAGSGQAGVSVGSTASVSEAGDTLASSGSVPVSATTSAADSADTVASSTGIAVSSSLSTTDGSDTLACAVTVGFAGTADGTLAVTEAWDTVAAAAVFTVHAHTKPANLFSNSATLTSGSWNNNSNVTQTLVTAPDGKPAYRIDYNGTADPMFGQNGLGTGDSLSGRTFTIQAEIWTDAGQSTELTLFIYNAGITDVGQVAKTLTTTPTLYSFTKTFLASTTTSTFTARFDPRNAAGAAGYIYLRYPQVSENNTATTYVETIGTQAGVVDGLDTVSAQVSVPASSTLAFSDSADTLSSAGTVEVGSSAAVAEAADSIVSSGVVDVVVTESATEQPDTVVSAAPVSVQARNSSRNRFPYSNDLSGAGWNRSSVTTTPQPNGAPNGVDTAYLFTCTGVSNSFISATPSLKYPVGTTITRCIDAKAGTSNFLLIERDDLLYGGATFNLTTGVATNGAGVTGSTENLGGGWWRCKATYTTLTVGSGGFAGIYVGAYGTGAAGLSVYLANPQEVIGASAPAYIPTFGVAAGVEEAADTVSTQASVPVASTLSATDSGDTLTSAVDIKLDVFGTLATTDAGDTVSATAVVPVTATDTTQEGQDTLASAAVVPLSASTNYVEGGDTVSAQVSAFITAQITAVESGDTLLGKFDNNTFILTSVQAQRLFNIALLHGLVPGAPLTVTQNNRSAGPIQQSVSTAVAGSISTVTVSTTSMAPTDWDVGKWINDLAALHGITTDLIVTPTSRTAGTIFQTMDNDGTDTVVERV